MLKFRKIIFSLIIVGIIVGISIILRPKVRSYLKLKQIPSGYYETDVFKEHANTLADLKKFLLYEFRMPKGYRTDEFDCSEMAAYLEWALEDAGFNASIVVGPFSLEKLEEGTKHAWIMAHTNDGDMAIESTALMSKDDDLFLYMIKFFGEILELNGGIIYKGKTTGWEEYYQEDVHSYESIYEAITKSKEFKEWSWWINYWGFK